MVDTVETMRAFVAVADEGGFTAAGRQLGLSTKLVSKYVARLESRLRAQLFHRTTRSVTLTHAGSAYLERCRPIIGAVDELDELVTEQQAALEGPVKMTAPTGFGSTRLPQALIPFLRSHPAVELELHLSDRRVALVEEGFDLAIRIGRLRDSTLVARKLGDMPLIVCAAPSYLDQHGRPDTPDDLPDFDCITHTDQADAVWRFHGADGERAVRLRGHLRANAPRAVTELALGGMGIARLPLYQISEALTSGDLVPLFDNDPSDTYGLYALYPPNRFLTARIRALIDHLAADFRSKFPLSRSGH